MKCNSCGANVKKSDEICPECGNYLAADPAPAEKSNGKTEKFGKTLRFYDYKEGLVTYSVWFVIFGLFVIGISAISIWNFGFRTFRFSSHNIEMLILAAFGFLFVIDGIISYFRLKSCSVTLCENGIYGYIPANPVIPFKTVYFEALFEDIEEIKRSGFGTTRHSQPKITVVTAGGKFTISFPKKGNTTALSDCFYEILDM